jgi:hypothetical protein
MKLQFKDTDVSLGTLLSDTADAVRGKTISLRDLLEQIGEQGLLLFCIILTLPFMLPVSIPGVSTVIGAVIILVGIGVTMNRIPWLPERLMSKTFEGEQLIPALEKGVELFGKVESFLKPRMTVLSEGTMMNTINGLVLTFAAILLIFPFGLIPFSNTLPALAILFLAVGIAQRDGVFILLGYIMTIATVIYFGGLFYAAIAAGQAVTSLFGSG